MDVFDNFIKPVLCYAAERLQLKFCKQVLGVNSPVTGEFPAQMASHAENVSILMTLSWEIDPCEGNTSHNIQQIVITHSSAKLHCMLAKPPLTLVCINNCFA